MTQEHGLDAARALMTRETRGIYTIYDDNQVSSIWQSQRGTTTFKEVYTNKDNQELRVIVTINSKIIDMDAITWPNATIRRNRDTIKLLDTKTGLYYDAPVSPEVALVIEQLRCLDPKIRTAQVYMTHFNMRRIHVGDNLFQLDIYYYDGTTTELFTVGPKTDMADVFGALNTLY